MIKNWCIVIPFNARWEDGCDYAQQTIALLAKKNLVVAIPLAHQRSVWQAGLQIWRAHTFFERYGRALVFTPICWLPLQRFAFLKTANTWLNASLIRFLVERTHINRLKTTRDNSRRLVWMFEPMNSVVFLRVFSNWQSLYDCVDFWPGFVGAIQRQHDWLVQHATWMVVNSLALVEVTRQVRPSVVQVPLGFAHSLFETVAAMGRRSSSREIAGIRIQPHQKVFGFIGQIGNRFDFPWLLDVIRAFPEHIFLFVGSIWVWRELPSSAFANQLAQLQAEPNCRFVDAVPKHKIPQLVSQFDVGLIPYNTKEIFNKNCHPLKLYEYWWFGLPVVATAIHELSRYSSWLFAGNRSDQAITWIKQVGLTYPTKTRRQVKIIARQNTWTEKLVAIASVITAERTN